MGSDSAEPKLAPTPSPVELVSAGEELLGVVTAVDGPPLDVDAPVVEGVAVVVVVVLALVVGVPGVDEMGELEVVVVVATVGLGSGPVTVVLGAVPGFSGESQAVSATRL